jgi:hypothetical protein
MKVIQLNIHLGKKVTSNECVHTDTFSEMPSVPLSSASLVPQLCPCFTSFSYYSQKTHVSQFLLSTWNADSKKTD